MGLAFQKRDAKKEALEEKLQKEREMESALNVARQANGDPLFR